MEVLFNEWNNAFYNSLQDKDKAAFFRSMGRFSVLAAVYIVLYIYNVYLNQWLQIRWRRWMTDRYLKEWLGNRVYYRMQLTGSQTDNPDQRIAEDLKMFVDETLNLGLGGLNAIVTLASFVRSCGCCRAPSNSRSALKHTSSTAIWSGLRWDTQS